VPTSELPGELFTSASIITLTGATGAVYVICGALQRAFNFNPRWLALAISVCIALAGAHATQTHHLVNYLVGIVNGCLIYCTATGVNSVFGGTSPASVAVDKGSVHRMGVGGTKQPRQTRRSFATRWT
jgi:hypothetical protein